MKITLTPEQWNQINNLVEKKRPKYVPGFGLFGCIDMEGCEEYGKVPTEVELYFGGDEGGSTYGMKEFYDPEVGRDE